MHRSRLGVVLVDHPPESYDAAAAFWAGAVGSPPLLGPAEDHPFEVLGELGGTLELAMQRTGEGTEPRVHLDIETDDVRAEVGRVVALGARVVDDRGEHVILADPGGVAFCVVPVQDAENFEQHASRWD